MRLSDDEEARYETARAAYQPAKIFCARMEVLMMSMALQDGSWKQQIDLWREAEKSYDALCAMIGER